MSVSHVDQSRGSVTWVSHVGQSRGSVTWVSHVRVLAPCVQDAVERVLVELGVGGRGALRDFYEARVVAYHARTRRLCEDLRDDYRRLSSPAVGQQARTQDRRASALDENHDSRIL